MWKLIAAPWIRVPPQQIKVVKRYRISGKMQTINFITGNKNKLAEFRAILGDVIDVQSRAVDVPEIQGTIEEIAKEKCRAAAMAVSEASDLRNIAVSAPLRFSYALGC
jgi:hypothetical protein